MEQKHTKKDTILTACGLATAAGLLLAFTTSTTEGSGDGGDDPYANLPDALELTGIVRDFREQSEEGGHTDFEQRPDAGFGHYVGNVALELDDEGKPVFTGEGNKVKYPARDAQGNPIAPHLANDAFNCANTAGYTQATLGAADPGGIESGNSFYQWFRNVPGVNESKPLTITLNRVEGTNEYVFDDREDPNFSELGGFFPINGELFGNSAGENKNFHFTYELVTEFRYKEGQGSVFTFRGDDDVWVFIDDKLVIDIGGVHAAVEQTVNLDDLCWLEDGETYTLRFFFAERHRTQSNFRIETTLNLRSAKLPNSGFLYD